MLFKIWRWRLEVKLRSLDNDKKIIFLGQELIRAVAKSGRNIISPVAAGLVHMDIYVQEYDDTTRGEISCINNNWSISLGKVDCIKWKSDQENSSPAIGSSQES